MEIKRTIQKKLSAWRQDPDQKPLILQGARQVGKTWSLKHFGASEFDNVAYS
jgi:predicted AAA+ superfamily ATPase